MPTSSSTPKRRSTFARSRIEADAGDRRGRARRRSHRWDRNRAARARVPGAHENWRQRPCSGTSWRPPAFPSHQPPARCTPMTYCAPTGSRSGWRSARRHRSPVTVIGFVSDVSYSGQGSSSAAAAGRPLPDDASRRSSFADDDVDQPADRHRHHRVADDHRRNRGDPRRSCAAVDVQPDHRCDGRDRGRRRGVVLRIAHRRAALLYGVLKALGARSSTLFAGVVAQAVVVTAVASVVAGGLAF